MEIFKRSGHRGKTFWCEEAGRMVIVEFAQEGPPLFRRETEILSCSAFDRPSQINCTRRCLDPFYRRWWPELIVR